MKKSKKLKGMTLIEIIIALAVFAMLGLILVATGSFIDNTTRATKNLKDKMVTQSPYAANQKTQFQDEDGNDVELDGEDVTIKVSLGADSVNVSGKKYCTEKLTKPDGMTAEEEAAYNSKPNSGLNFKFIEVERTTEATT